MKYLYLFLLIAIPFLCQAQEAPKNSKQIIITIDSTKTQEVIVKDFVSYLTRNGYEIDGYNKDLNLITTKGKDVKFWQMRLSIFIDGDKLKFAGTAYAGLYGHNSSWVIENKGSMGSVYVHTWREMNTIANGFPHSSVEYLK